MPARNHEDLNSDDDLTDEEQMEGEQMDEEQMDGEQIDGEQMDGEQMDEGDESAEGVEEGSAGGFDFDFPGGLDFGTSEVEIRAYELVDDEELEKYNKCTHKKWRQDCKNCVLGLKVMFMNTCKKWDEERKRYLGTCAVSASGCHLH